MLPGGETKTFTDRNGSVHTYTRDVLGRTTIDAVTTLGSGVDGGVRRIETAFDSQGNAYKITSYDAASSGNVVNEVLREFNGLGQMTKEYQEHGGAVNTGTSLKVQYAWSKMSGSANHSRLTAITYPNGKVLTYNYSSGLNSNISRLSSLSDTTGTLESYEYLGYGIIVKRGHSQPGVDLTYIKQSGESNGDAGDQYTGLDRFDRITDHRWIKTSSGTHTDRHQYGYDRNSNRLWRDNLVNSAFGEVYQYDNLNQLTSFKRGTLNAGKTDVVGTPARSQTWDHDALGNFDAQNTDGTNQTRSHNRQNEITSISGATTPTYDANGNLTKDETGRTYEYDAWNRLVRVKNSGGSTLVKYEYDGLFRRIAETRSGTTTDFYYSSAWQVLEERVGGNAKIQYVWSPVYVDAMILRDRDAAGDSALEERLWVMHDANFNVTGLLDNSGNVVERYAYDPFGVATYYDASWGSRGSSLYAWIHLHQGGRLDWSSGNYHFRFRDYSPTLGRWLTMDPIGYAAGDVGLYRAYACSPTNGRDPTGNVVILGGERIEPYSAKFDELVEKYSLSGDAYRALLMLAKSKDTFSYETVADLAFELDLRHMVCKAARSFAAGNTSCSFLGEKPFAQTASSHWTNLANGIELKSTSKPSVAVRDLLKTDTRLDCAGGLYLAILVAILAKIGDSAFDKHFREIKLFGIRSSCSVQAVKSEKINRSEVIPGDWRYIRAPGCEGAHQGQNVICLSTDTMSGEQLFWGFGVLKEIMSFKDWIKLGEEHQRASGNLPGGPPFLEPNCRIIDYELLGKLR